ncbi:MAG: hypothetical protein KAQ99_09800 [Candidatus Aureabacteria bacterium]|nr:hypothetical protein [Candidatus Auribacterota bacterium]
MWFSTNSSREKNLMEIAAGQAGYFTAKQALKAGYSHRLQHYHRAKGHWQEINRGIFRFAQYPHSPTEDLVRWSLWSRDRNDTPQGVFSHETALSVHELSDIMPAKIHLTVSPKFRKKIPDGCILHKALLKNNEIEKREGYSVTTPLKTIIDVAEGTLSLDYLEKAVRDAIELGFLRPKHIQNAIMTKKTKKKMRLILKEIMENPLL